MCEKCCIWPHLDRVGPSKMDIFKCFCAILIGILGNTLWNGLLRTPASPQYGIFIMFPSKSHKIIHFRQPTRARMAAEILYLSNTASHQTFLVWYGMAWHGLVWHGMVWFGLVWFGLVYRPIFYLFQSQISIIGTLTLLSFVLLRSVWHFSQTFSVPFCHVFEVEVR